MSLPIVELSGAPYEQGIQQADALKERILHNVEVYFDRFRREGRLSDDQIMDRARQYQAAMENQSEPYMAMIRGMADRLAIPVEALVAVNVRYEILYDRFTANALEDNPDFLASVGVQGECTGFAILPERSANGHLLLGQNWDWIPQVKGALLRTTEPDGLQTLSFTEAGVVAGKIGFNSAGVGITVNGLMSLKDDWARLQKPFHMRCYYALRTRNLKETVHALTGTPRSCSANFLIACAPDQAVDVEMAPDTHRLLSPENGTLVHTNHFLDPTQLQIIEPPSEKRPHSYHRRARLLELLEAEGSIGIGDMQNFLQDRDGYPYSICRDADESEPSEEHYITVTSVIMDMQTRSLWITDGQPDRAPYETYAL